MAVEDFEARQLALIKAARSLEDTTRPLDEKINDLWPLLTASKGGRSCAAEETIMRWLLKHMEGTTEAAEQLRRYPLTWTTLACLLERISPFSLSKIFLERRFILVLRQSARDISRPRKKDESKPMPNRDRPAETRKRKRDEALTFNIDILRSPELLLESATELFGALDVLVSRLGAMSNHNAEHVVIGAEHVKSIFRTPANEAQELVAPLLWICVRAMDIHEAGLLEQQQRWVGVLATIWSLRLGSMSDGLAFATHVYYPSCSILGKLRRLGSEQGNQAVRRLWIKQVERLLMKNLINPARTSYTNSNSLDVLEAANQAAVHHVAQSVPILWSLAVLIRRNSDDPASKKAHLSWAQSVFTLLLNFAQENNSGETVVSVMLDIAIESGCPPDLKALRSVCKKYALQDKSTDWNLVANITQSNPDVFLLDDESLGELLSQATSLSRDDETEREIVIERIISPLMAEFSITRNLRSFVEKWHRQLSLSLTKSSLGYSVWFDIRIRDKFAELLQNDFTVKQLTALLDWLDEQDPADGAYLVILDAVSDGITQQKYIDAVNWRVFKAAFHGHASRLPSELEGLRWRIVGITAARAPADHIHIIWEMIGEGLSEILRKAPLSEAATLEAFSCCSKLCLANVPSGGDLAEFVQLLQTFLKRFNADFDVSKDIAVLPSYLGVAFTDLSRLSEVSGEGNSDISIHIANLFQRFESYLRGHDNSSRIRNLIQETSDLHDEELLINILARNTIDALDNSVTVCGWIQPQSVPIISTLLDFPREHFTRDRRKRIMSSWKKWKSEIKSHANSNAQYAKLVLRLLVLVMQQTTFYPDMAFSDILDFSVDLSRGSSDLLPLVEKMIELTIGQVIESPEQSSLQYLQEVAYYVENLDVNQLDDKQIHLILLKNIVSALKRIPAVKSANRTLDQGRVAPKLRELVEHNISQFASKSQKLGNVIGDQQELRRLNVTFSAVDSIKEELSVHALKLSSKTVSRIQTAGDVMVSQGVEAGWKLHTLVAYNTRPDSIGLVERVGQAYPESPAKHLVFDFVDAFTGDSDTAVRLELLYQVSRSSSTWRSPSVPYLALERIVATIQVSTPFSIPVEGGKTFDLATLQVELAELLTEATSLEQFINIAQILLLLLQKHVNSMTQVNIEATLSIIVAVCSAEGPKIRGVAVPGKIFHILYQLVAAIIKRHRLRLEGHNHLLVTAIQAMLRVLLADPSSPQSKHFTSFSHPPWLDSRLKVRHATEFTRLLTLICEPSAASVARGKNNILNSATDTAKRSAGQHMFRVLMLYIKLQLEGDVSKEFRTALEPGVYSVLSITPENGKEIMNESMDASGRAIFRRMYGDYMKFGKWGGI
ncbi:Urb2/Npa2 family-domain-containing protein [Xylariales sp. AK1849]|nr:Urb2/Npa2 family-domain-containing protein [Xylariales sp. AK1849]